MLRKGDLDKIAKYHVSKDEGGFIHGWSKVSRRLMDERFSIIQKHSVGDTALEIGFADGNLTENLVKFFKNVVAIDGSKFYCNRVKEIIKSKNLEVVETIYEDYKGKDKFHTIVLSHIIEHVENPGHLLEWSKERLKRDGVIIIITNSTGSLHRHMGTKLGILKSPEDFTEYDKKLGHKILFNYQSLNGLLISKGLNIKAKGGFYLKMLSNIQVEQQWTDEMIEASIALGYDFPEIAAEIFFVAGRG